MLRTRIPVPPRETLTVRGRGTETLRHLTSPLAGRAPADQPIEIAAISKCGTVDDGPANPLRWRLIT